MNSKWPFCVGWWHLNDVYPFSSEHVHLLFSFFWQLNCRNSISLLKQHRLFIASNHGLSSPSIYRPGGSTTKTVFWFIVFVSLKNGIWIEQSKWNPWNVWTIFFFHSFSFFYRRLCLVTLNAAVIAFSRPCLVISLIVRCFVRKPWYGQCCPNVNATMENRIAETKKSLHVMLIKWTIKYNWELNSIWTPFCIMFDLEKRRRRRINYIRFVRNCFDLNEWCMCRQ